MNVNQTVQSLFLLLIRGYRLLLSPWFGSQCRFYPSCSAYAEEAVHTHGAWKGLTLTLARLGKCHPWHPGGHDPVPARKPRKENVHG
jgi:putative membrane protein insertion efficiency factor